MGRRALTAQDAVWFVDWDLFYRRTRRGREAAVAVVVVTSEGAPLAVVWGALDDRQALLREAVRTALDRHDRPTRLVLDAAHDPRLADGLGLRVERTARGRQHPGTGVVHRALRRLRELREALGDGATLAELGAASEQWLAAALAAPVVA